MEGDITPKFGRESLSLSCGGNGNFSEAAAAAAAKVRRTLPIRFTSAVRSALGGGGPFLVFEHLARVDASAL